MQTPPLSNLGGIISLFREIAEENSIPLGAYEMHDGQQTFESDLDDLNLSGNVRRVGMDLTTNSGGTAATSSGTTRS